MGTSLIYIVRNRKKSNGTYPVYWRLIHNRQTIFRSTPIEVNSDDLDKELNIKKNRHTNGYLDMLDQRANELREKIYKLVLSNPHIDIDKLVEIIENKDPTQMDFFEYFETVWLVDKRPKMNERSLNLYKYGIKKFQQYIESKEETAFVDIYSDEDAMRNDKEESEVKLPICQLKGKLLQGFADALHFADIQGVKGYAKIQSSYPLYVKTVFKHACKKYNDDDNIVINDRQLDNFKGYPERKPSKRSIQKDEILKLASLEIKEKNTKTRANLILAREVFLLSFCLMGTNMIDLWELTTLKNGTISYIRQKLKSRRGELARMEIEIPKQIQAIFDKYHDLSGSHVFNFQKHNKSYHSFFQRYNRGLKHLQTKYGIGEDIHFTFYAARHTMATEVNEKFQSWDLVGELLCHSKKGMETTERYITVDMKNLNKKNKEFLDDIFGEETIIKAY